MGKDTGGEIKRERWKPRQWMEWLRGGEANAGLTERVEGG